MLNNSETSTMVPTYSRGIGSKFHRAGLAAQEENLPFSIFWLTVGVLNVKTSATSIERTTASYI